MNDSPPPSNPAPFRALLICPDERPAVSMLSRRCPLVLSPFLGKTVLSHALTDLATQGATAVTVLVSDRAEAIEEAVGHGEAWGLKLDLVSPHRELAPAEALAKHGAPQENSGLAAAREAHLLDYLPLLSDQPLWESYSRWFATLLAFMPRAAHHQVGMRETAPGVWVGMRTRIAQTAKVTGPCWIGSNVFIGPRCVIGPDTVIEDGAYVEESAEVASSMIGPKTYLGALTELRHSFAWGDGLLNLPTGSFTAITDGFLLRDLASSSGTTAEPAGEELKPGRASLLGAFGPANLLGRARAIAPGFWRKWSGRGGDAS